MYSIDMCCNDRHTYIVGMLLYRIIYGTELFLYINILNLKSIKNSKTGINMIKANSSTY